MPVREQARRGIALAGFACMLACEEPKVSVEPSERPPSRPAPVLSGADEALLASLLAEDPGDFHGRRARIWRIGPARWIAGGPEFAARPSEGLRGGALEQPLEVVVVDADGPTVLLPLGDLDRGSRAPSWSALRLVAALNPGDLVPGLTRELRPTPWLTVAAGVGLTPLEREDDHLRVTWSDPACGFGLELELDTADFGPLYEPGPSGRPTDEPEPSDAPALRLAPGTQLFADAEGKQPIIRVDPEAPSESARLSAAQRVRRIGQPSKKKLQQIELRCRGVAVTGYVAPASLVELPGRFAVVEPIAPPSSTCANQAGTAMLVPAATILYEPETSRAPAVVGVVASDVELNVRASADGWSRACVPSPWGDLVFDFRAF